MTESKSTNIKWHAGLVSQEEREKILGQKGVVLWMTGLSGSGKSTLARAVEKDILEMKKNAYVLDGDNVRHGLNKNLGFSPEDRTENIRRIGEVAKLFCDANIITLTAFVSPYRADRDKVRALLNDGQFIEVFCDTPIDICESRDPKGLYKKARAGEIKDFTGINAPYEAPVKPELHLQTGTQSIEDLSKQVITYLNEKGFLS